MRLLVVSFFGFVLLVACGGSNGTESAATTTAEPAVTATSEPVATATSEPAATSTSEPTATATVEPVATTTPISDERLAAAAAVGDIAAGQELFNEPLDGVNHSLSCSSCHTIDGQLARNPTFVGTGTVAGDRIAGVSDVEYIRQSIVDPYAFKADGEWLSAAMPYVYADLLSEDQINNLIAYVLTR